MKILRSSQIREVDNYTIENEPIISVDLMERASMAASAWINKNISKKNNVKIFIGPGNNGGDGLAMARQLNQLNFKVEVYFVKISGRLSIDNEINLSRLKKEDQVFLKEINSKNDFPEISSTDILIDALFGSGLARPLDGLAKETVQFMNNSEALIIAIDIPSGLFGEDNTGNKPDAIIKASYTLTFQIPKLAFFFPSNNIYAGTWIVLPIGLNKEFIHRLDTPYYFIEENNIKAFLKNRKKFSHKGDYGHILLISGGYGKMGAAVLAAKACLRAGCGLLTSHIPKDGCGIMQTAVPESMLSIDISDIIFTDAPDPENYTSVAVGPGIGVKKNTQKGIRNLLEKLKTPMVIDADAINVISENRDLIHKIPKNSILTPHPKEFERLIGKQSEGYERLQLQIEFAVKNKVIVVLKGAHTSIATPDGMCYFNSTGNPGMATAGSGDVLTGIILSLLGQSYDPMQAAILGVYLHGLAGDIAAGRIGQEALIASDIIDNLGNAYLKLRK